MLAVLAFAATDGYAQPAASPGHEQPPSRAVDDQELKGLIETLKDDRARAKLVEQLDALLAARQNAQNGGAESDGEDGSWLSSLSDSLRDTVGRMFAVGSAFAGLPRWVDRIMAGAQDADTRVLWLESLAKIVIILAAGYAAQIAVNSLLARPRRAIGARHRSSVWRCAALAALYAVLELLPLAAFGAAALGVAPLTDPDKTARLVALALINARLVTGAVLVAGRLVLAPQADSLRLLPLTGETAHYLYIWTARIAVVAVYGYFILEALRLLGLPGPMHGFFYNLLGLSVAILLIILILQNRDSVSDRIRPPEGADNRFGVIRRPLAAAWHMLAIFYVGALYLVLAIHGHGGTGFILRGTLFTALIACLAWLVEGAGHKAIHSGLTISDGLRSRFPGLQWRLNRYTVALDYGLRIVVFFFALIATLEAWGFQVLPWILSPTGERVFSASANIIVIVVLAIVIWEVASSFIERRLSPGAAGRAPTTRARTLLPLAQTTLKIVLFVLVTMVVLAEVGVNITPLIAGAGVVGLAVGFGAQKLVQDVITGWFILMEDTIAVGDVAEVAGHSGLIERISIRTVRLRDMSGVVHTIPFSTIDSVKNFSKEFSYYLLEVRVSYREDTDAVVAVLRELDEEMRKDPAYGSDIIEPLEVIGVDRFEDSAVVITARIKTLPLRQWTVGREFNRRMKKAFEACDIELPFPHRTLYFGVGKDQKAPPAHVRIDQETSQADAGRDPEQEAEAGKRARAGLRSTEA
jgi:small conductance mechanosensitive channel